MRGHQGRSYGPEVTADDRSTRPPAGEPPADEATPRYEIRVKGHLGPRWSAWFEGLSLTIEDDGTTVIHGSVVDQAALHGVLQRLRDVGIPLVSVTPLPPDAPTEPPAPDTGRN